MDNKQNEWDNILKKSEMKQNIYEDEEPSKKSRLFKIGFIIILFIFIGSFGWYYIVELSPKKIIIDSITKINDNVSFMYKPILTIPKVEDNFTNTGDLSFNIESNFLKNTEYQGIIDKLNTLKINYNLSNDKKNKKTFINLDTSLDQKDFLGMIFYQNNNEQYIYLKEIYDKYIRFSDKKESSSIESESKNISLEDALYLIEIVKKSLRVNFDDKLIYKKVLLENNTPLIEATLTITDEDINKLYVNVREDLKNDSKSKEIIEYYYDDFFNDSNNLINDSIVYTYTVVTTMITNDLKSINFKVSSYDYKGDSIVNIISYKINDNSQIITTTENNIITEKKVIKKNNANDFTLTNYTINAENKEEISFVINGKKEDIGYTYSYETVDSDYSNTLKFTINNSDNNYNYILEDKFSMEDYYLNLKVELKGNISNTSNINENIDDYILYSDMTDTESEDIKNKIITKLNEVLYGSDPL